MVPVDQLQPAGGPGHGGELLGDAEPGQDPVDLVVEVHRPRLGVDPVPAVQDEALDAVLAEQGGGGDAHRAGSHDDDGDRIGAACAGTCSSEVAQHEDDEGRRHRAEDEGRGDLTHAVAVAEVRDHGPAEQQQQSRGGQGADQRDGRADEQPEDGEDLEQADPPVGRRR